MLPLPLKYSIKNDIPNRFLSRSHHCENMHHKNPHELQYLGIVVIEAEGSDAELSKKSLCWLIPGEPFTFSHFLSKLIPYYSTSPFLTHYLLLTLYSESQMEKHCSPTHWPSDKIELTFKTMIDSYTTTSWTVDQFNKTKIKVNV